MSSEPPDFSEEGFVVAGTQGQVFCRKVLNLKSGGVLALQLVIYHVLGVYRGAVNQRSGYDDRENGCDTCSVFCSCSWSCRCSRMVVMVVVSLRLAHPKQSPGVPLEVFEEGLKARTVLGLGQREAPGQRVSVLGSGLPS